MVILKSVQQHGFTLVELMMVVSIIGILLAIAVPSYTTYVNSSRENDGREDIYRIMAQQERYFLKNMVYTVNLGLGGIGYSIAAGAPLTSPEGYFRTTAMACSDATTQVTGSCIRLETEGLGAQNGTDFWLESDGDQSDNL
jgi:type IV pilus assembly protein PilE